MRAGAAAGASALALGGASSAAAQSLVWETTDTDMHPVPGTEHFMLFNNQWGNEAADQRMYAYDDGSFGWEFSGGGGGINYPEVFIGHRPWGTDTGAPELSNITLGEIEELTFEFDVNVDVNAGDHYNLTEEFWLLNGPPNQDGDTITHEIMMLCDWGGGHEEAHSPKVEEGLWTDQFGNTIDYWDETTGGSGDAFHIFAPQEPMTTGKIDLTPLVDYLIEEMGVPESRQVSAIELGTETFDGPTGEVDFEHFGVTVNGSHYSCGPGDGPGPQPPTSPDDVWTNEVTDSTVDLGWTAVDAADEYDVYLDGSRETTTSATSTTVTGLESGTQYTVGVEAVNDAGSSERQTTTATTEAATTPVCEGAEGGSMEVEGQTVCDVNDDGSYRDVNGDGELAQDDVVAFFENQHRSAWKQDAFDFSGNGEVNQFDVVDLFDYVVTL